MKVGIVGAGAVGSACLLSLIISGSAREIVLVNADAIRTALNKLDFSSRARKAA